MINYILVIIYDILVCGVLTNKICSVVSCPFEFSVALNSSTCVDEAYRQ